MRNKRGYLILLFLFICVNMCFYVSAAKLTRNACSSLPLCFSTWLRIDTRIPTAAILKIKLIVMVSLRITIISLPEKFLPSLPDNFQSVFLSQFLLSSSQFPVQVVQYKAADSGFLLLCDFVPDSIPAPLIELNETALDLILPSIDQSYASKL